MRTFILVLCLMLLLIAAPPARALKLDVGIKAGVAVLNSDLLRGYGGGFGCSLALSIFSPFTGATLGLFADVQFVLGFGTAIAISAGPYFRYTIGPWAPDFGVYLQYTAGALVRIGDDEGRLPGNPLAFQLGLAPLRFVNKSKNAWISFLATRYGWTFAEGGASVVLTIAGIEVGRTF